MAASRFVPRLRSFVASLVCAGLSAAVSAAGCNGTGVTPICTFADGALDPEAGCGAPVEASVGDALDEASPPDGDDDVDAASDAAGNADDASQDAADAAVLDAALHDAAIQDAHSDSKG